MTQTAQHDTTMSYDIEGALDPRWTDLMYQALSDESVKLVFETRDSVESINISGPCPRCGGPIRFDQILTAANTDTAGFRPAGQSAAVTTNKDATLSPTMTFIAYCTCDGPHGGRPANVTAGCGAAFRIEVTTA